MPLTILTVGTLGMGSAIVTSVERHSSRLISEKVSYDKVLFAEIKSPIFVKPKFTKSLLYIDILL